MLVIGADLCRTLIARNDDVVSCFGSVNGKLEVKGRKVCVSGKEKIKLTVFSSSFNLMIRKGSRFMPPPL